MVKKKMPMENMVINKKFSKFFYNKKILILGNTGFVGSWLTILLSLLRANLLGISLKMEDKRYISNSISFKKNHKTLFLDINNFKKLEKKILQFKPDIIIHLASQPIVFEALKNPKETFLTNLMGTVNLLEISRKLPNLKKLLIFTSDKVYKTTKKKFYYHENSEIGGSDPYSTSKSCQDLISKCYSINYFFKIQTIIIRSGNIIGGGDWSKKRLIPDIINSYFKKKNLLLRNKNAIRPWIHVFDVLNGILLSLINDKKNNKRLNIYNFAPSKKNQISVGKILELIKTNTTLKNLKYEYEKQKFKESKFLRLSCKLAKSKIGWSTKLNIIDGLKNSINWYLLTNKKNTYEYSKVKLKEYFKI